MRRTTGRRTFLGAASAAALAAPAALRSAAPSRKYRAAVIGHTGRGDYGHGIDTVWLSIPNVEIAAVADADEKGLAAAVKRLRAPRGFADYRRMLDETRPDLVSIGPRWLDQHRDMVVAAATRGVRGIYIEKPLARTPAEADEMIAACAEHKVKAAVAHQTRYSPRVQVVRDLIAAGTIGKVLELRGRGKEDRRGGGEDLWVLGSHIMNLMHHIGGAPQFCFAVVRQDGRPIRREDARPGNEGIGPLAGDEVHAMYGLAGGAVGFFDSVRNATGEPWRFGITIHGSKGIIELGTGYLPPVFLLPDSSWSPGRTGKQWVAVSSQGPEKPEPLPDGGLDAGNVAAAKDLIAAIEEDREPVANFAEVRTAIEMILAVFGSHLAGTPVAFPLANRGNPLA